MRHNLATIRKSRGLTQKQLAECAGVTIRQYQYIEAGASNSTLSVWEALAKALGKPIDYLFKDDQRA